MLHSVYITPVMYLDPSGEFALFFVTAIFGAIFGAVVGGIEAYINGENLWGGIIQGFLVGGALGFAFGTGVAFLGPMLASAGAGTLTSTSILSAVYSFAGSTIISFSAAAIGYTINEELNNRNARLRDVLGFSSLIAVESMINYTWGGIVGQFGKVGELNFPKPEWFGKQAMYRVFASPGVYLIDKVIDILY